MKKRLTVGLTLLLAAVLLTGCTAKEQPGGPVGPDMQLLGGGHGEQPGRADAAGYYSLENPAGTVGARWLFYTDYEKGTRGYLCGDMDCDHSTASCTAWVDAPVGDSVSVYTAGDRLYLFHSGRDTFSGSCRIEQRALDGTGSRVVYTAERSTSIGGMSAAWDGQALYFITTDTSTSPRDNHLCRLDPETGEMAQLCVLPSETVFFSDTVQDKLLLRINDAPGDSPEGRYMLVDGQGNCIDSPVPADWRGWQPLQARSKYLDGGCIYTLDGDTGNVYAMDVQTREETLLANTPADQEYVIYAKVAGHLVLVSYDFDHPGDQILSYTVNCATGQVQEVSRLTYDDYGEEHILRILAVVGDRLLTVSRAYTVTLPAQPNDKGITEEQWPREQYAFITVQDYLAGNAVFDEIKTDWA